MSLLKSWTLECDLFQGDKALFWAGKISETIGYMEHTYPINYSTYFSLLVDLKTNYDNEILSRITEPIVRIEV